MALLCNYLSNFTHPVTDTMCITCQVLYRAVMSSGEYASAIETLVTAISLIKQSKVSSDERCKILISSLQDTLHGIEAKSYGRKERGERTSYLSCIACSAVAGVFGLPQLLRGGGGGIRTLCFPSYLGKGRREKLCHLG